MPGPLQGSVRAVAVTTPGYHGAVSCLPASVRGCKWRGHPEVLPRQSPPPSHLPGREEAGCVSTAESPALGEAGLGAELKWPGTQPHLILMRPDDVLMNRPSRSATRQVVNVFTGTVDHKSCDEARTAHLASQPDPPAAAGAQAGAARAQGHRPARGGGSRSLSRRRYGRSTSCSNACGRLLRP